MGISAEQALALDAAKAEALGEGELKEALGHWVKAGNAALPEALAGSSNKAAARLARKALYQLKSKGVEAKAPSRPEPAAAPAPAAPSDELPGLLSHVLGTGERALFFGRPQRGGGLELYQCILHDELGLQQLSQAESNRAAFRRRVREVRERKEPILEVGLDRVREELGRAWGQSVRAKSPVPTETDALLRRLGIERLDALPDVPAPAPEDAGLAARAGALFEQPEIAEWLPPEPELRALAQTLDEAATSPLALTPAQQADARASKVAARAKAFFTPAVRQLYGRRLWAMGEVYQVTGRAEAGALARSAARQLFHGEGPTAFGERLFARVLELSPAAPPPGAQAAALPPPSAPRPPARGPALPPPSGRKGPLILP